MKKILATSILVCSTILIAWAQVDIDNQAKFTYDDINKTAECHVIRERNNTFELVDYLFPGMPKTLSFLTDIQNNTTINKHIQLDGNSLIVSDEIPEGQYEIPLSICHTRTTESRNLKTTSLPRLSEYRYEMPLPPPPPEEPPVPQPAPIEDDVLDL